MRRKRDRVSIGMATSEELTAISGSLEGQEPRQGVLDPWCAVAIRVDGRCVIHLVGDLRGTELGIVTFSE